MKLLPLALAAGVALCAVNAHADGKGTAGGCSSADATCIGGSRGNRPLTGAATRGDLASMGAAGCRQGEADSTCAIPVGQNLGSYVDLNARPNPTPCRALAANQWAAACPPGMVGSILYQSDYSCGLQKVYLTGSLTPTMMVAEPGQYGPGYVVSNSCVTPTPPTPPAPTYTRIYLLSIDTFETTSTSRATITIQRNNLDGAGATYLLTRSGPWYGVDFTLPWGFDYRPMYGPSDGANNPDAMRPPMQFFIDKGCKLVSDDPSLRNTAAAAYGQYFGGLTVWKSFWYGGFGDGYTNYAFCPNDVGIG